MRLRDILAGKGKSKAAQFIERHEKNTQLDEGRKYVDVNNHEKIGIDNPHVPGQKVHAHLEDGRAVNKDGSLSHGGKPFYLTKAQAAALEKIEFQIPKSRLIESEGGPKITLELDAVLVELLRELQNSLRN